jgi:hypothetical protein
VRTCAAEAFDAARQFFGERLGLRSTCGGLDSCVFKVADGCYLELRARSGAHSTTGGEQEAVAAAPGQKLVMVCDDVDEWQRVLLEASVPMLTEPSSAAAASSIAGGDSQQRPQYRSLTCLDPAGGHVELRQYVDPGLLDGESAGGGSDLDVFRERLDEVGLGSSPHHCVEEEGHLIVWFGSHTGTGAGLAAELVRSARERGLPAVAHDLHGEQTRPAQLTEQTLLN